MEQHQQQQAAAAAAAAEQAAQLNAAANGQQLDVNTVTQIANAAVAAAIQPLQQQHQQAVNDLANSHRQDSEQMRGQFKGLADTQQNVLERLKEKIEQQKQHHEDQIKDLKAMNEKKTR